MSPYKVTTDSLHGNITLHYTTPHETLVDLVQSLVISAESVHDGDRQPARAELLVTLGMKLLVDIVQSDQLQTPGLGAGAEVRPGHHHGLDQ